MYLQIWREVYRSEPKKIDNSVAAKLHRVLESVHKIQVARTCDREHGKATERERVCVGNRGREKSMCLRWSKQFS